MAQNCEPGERALYKGLAQKKQFLICASPVKQPFQNIEYRFGTVDKVKLTYNVDKTNWGGNTCQDPITFNGNKLALDGKDFDPVEITTKTPNEFLVKSKSDPKDQGLVLTNVTADSMKITSLASGDNFVLARCK